MNIRRMIARAAVAVAVCLAGAGLFGSTYYGVFVGVNYYANDPDNYNALVGCDRDAINVMDAYTAFGYCETNNATVYLDYDATKADVRAKFQALAGVAKAGDTVLYYQSSHGSDYNDEGGSLLCMTDGYWYDYEFAEDLSLFESGVRVVVMIDACYSGGMFKAGGSDGRPRFQFAANAQRILNEKLAACGGGQAKSGAGVGWITACDWDQLSLATAFGSVFTNAIIDGWKGAADADSSGVVTFAELGRYAVDMINSVEEQNTQVENEALLASVDAGTVFDLTEFHLMIYDDILYGFVGACPASLTIPEGIADIADSAFDADYNDGVDAITDVTFPESLESIGAYAFYDCANLASVTFLGGDDDVEIDATAFIGTLVEDEYVPWPENDAFEDAEALEEDVGIIEADTTLATYENGEPLYTRYSSRRTLWYSWTAPGRGDATFDTDGSEFDTVLGVYIGSSLYDLTKVAENDDDSDGIEVRTSRVTFETIPGITYYIAVGGYGSNYGELVLSWQYEAFGEDAPPSPISGGATFATAASIYGAGGSLAGNNVAATYEDGEPLNTGSSQSTHTLWYNWTAPCNGTFTFETAGSAIDTVMGVYTGSAVASLTAIGENDDAGANTRTSAVTFEARAGATYYIAVGGYRDTTGAISLAWSMEPDNDDFANAKEITGESGTIEDNNDDSTYEAGEPLYSQWGSVRTAWFRWTAPSSANFTFDTEGSDFDTVLGVYTGSSVGSLSVVAENDDAGCALESAVTFRARAGATYYICVGGYGKESGDFALNWFAGTYGTVAFVANGGQGAITSLGMGYDEVATLPACTFTRPGYRFLGWAESAYANEPEYADGDCYCYEECGVGSSATLYAVWESVMLWEPVAKPGSGVAGDAPFTGEYAEVYDAAVYDADGNLAGTIQVKTAKARISRSSKAAACKVTTTIQLAGKGKVTLKGEMNVAGGVFTAADKGGELRLAFGANGLSGTYGDYIIDGAENKFTSRDSDDKATADAMLTAWGGPCGVAWAGAGGWNCLTLTVAAKGKVKVGGSLADGTKITGKAQLIVGRDECLIPVVVTKKATLAFTVRLFADGQVKVEGLGDGVRSGKAGVLAEGSRFAISREAALWSRLVGSVFLEYLPDGVLVKETRGRWQLPKAGKVAYVGGTTNIDTTRLLDNPAALKLTYKAKDGSFKGAFNVYSAFGGRVKTTKANVVGVVVNGVGYATVTIRNVGSVGAEVR